MSKYQIEASFELQLNDTPDLLLLVHLERKINKYKKFVFLFLLLVDLSRTNIKCGLCFSSLESMEKNNPTRKMFRNKNGINYHTRWDVEENCLGKRSATNKALKRKAGQK